MARRKGGLFLPLDVGFMDDDKVLDAGERAGWLYVAMALFCKRTGSDGLITTGQIERLGVAGWRKRLDDLTRPLGIDKEPMVRELFPGTFELRAWFNHNDATDLVAQRRRKDAERKRASERNPNGTGADSERTPSVEKRREEQREEEQNSRGPVIPKPTTPLSARDAIGFGS